MKLYKNLVLSFSYSKESQCYVSCTDLCAVKKLVSEDQWKVNLKGLFYIYQAMNPNIKSIRSGMVLVIECLGFSPSKAGGVNHFKRVGDELLNCYPAKHQAMKHYHSGIFSNVAVAIVKPFLPKELRDAIEVGCLYDGRLDSLFLVPDAETAQRRNYFRIMDTLKLRYDNERQFSVLWPALDAPQTQS
ncbi:expressed unknown protein [Seminavis robusta]|uniref:Uncharacterized protein n=1 Tax=Seminavis robusta TaxID=568900 RepID=A0A9N8ER10_9STRA|nr:expressed unknown protein [Seminavis robusta]|eukprot:Sro1375_g267380.1 n/a (188) ;mRNA; r:17596-18159